MAKKKRVNKNLVAFLTVMGILLTVVVVAIATSQGARKDPEFWAEKARKFEQAGDYELAMEMFGRAYRASRGPDEPERDVSYLVESARCAYEYGQIGEAYNTLRLAHSEQPTDELVLVAFLERCWELYQPHRYWLLPQYMREDLLEYAEDLRSVDPENVLGPVSEAVARWALVDRTKAVPADWAAGDEALQRALELDRHDHRAVLANIQWERRKARDRLRQAEDEGARGLELEMLAEEYSEELKAKRLAILAAAVEANPADSRLVGEYVNELRMQEQQEKARSVVERALAEREDDPELHLSMAGLGFQEAFDKRAELTPEAYAQMLSESTAHARRAVELEPAMYPAYVKLAQAELTRDLKETGMGEISPERYEAALRIYQDAIDKTVGVRSLQAVLGEVQRRLMYARAFNTAAEYRRKATTAAERRERLEWVRRFLEPTEVRYPGEPFTCYMRGRVAAMEGRIRPAIQAFEQAEDLANADASGHYPWMWFELFGGVLPVHRLAMLYREFDQPGKSLEYTDLAIKRYESKEIQEFLGGKRPPLSLMLNRAELLTQHDRSQEARDFAAGLRRTYAEALAANEVYRLRLATVEAEALRLLGREEDAQQALADLGTSDVRMQLVKARLALLDADHASVETVLGELLTREDLSTRQVVRVLQLLMPTLVETGKQEEGKRILADVRDRLNPDGVLDRLLDRYEVSLSYSDPEERDAQLRALIEAEPAGLLRAQLMYNFHLRRAEYEQAAKFLNEVEKDRPDDPEILARQFRMALQLKQFDRADEYAARLTQMDADGAGGATHRGALALARDEVDLAIREYREALAKLPGTSALHAALGGALLEAQRHAEAVAVLEKAVQLNPRDFNAQRLLYIAYQNLPFDQRPEDGGDAHLLAAAKLEPDDPFIEKLAPLIEDKADPLAGIERREERRAAEPDDVENLIYLAKLYVQVGDEEQAAARFAEAAQREPGNLNLAKEAANFYGQTKRRAAGEEHLRAFIESQSPAHRGDGHLLRALFYELMDDVEAAETAYQEAKRVYEENVEDPEERRAAVLRAGLGLIDLYGRRGGRDLSLVAACRWALDKLSADDPRTSVVRRTIVLGLMSLGQLGDAEKELEAFARDYPDDVDGLVLRAQLKLVQRDWDDAYNTLARVLRNRPDQVWSLMNHGRLAVRRGEYVVALEDLKRARRLLDAPRSQQRGGEPSLLLQTVCSELAGVYEITKQYELAEVELRKMLEVLESRSEAAATVQEAADRLVSLHQRAGQLEKAKQVVSEHMARHPTSAFWPFRFATMCIERGAELTHLADAAKKKGNLAGEGRYRDDAKVQYQTAGTYLRQAEQLAQERNPGFAMACLAYRLDALAAAGQASEAVRLFEQTLARGTRMPAVVHAASIRAYCELNRRPEALRQLEMAVRAGARRDVAAVHAAVGWAQQHLPPEQAIAVLRKVAEALPEETSEGLRLRSFLATELVGIGQAEEALQIATAVVAKAPVGTGEWGECMTALARALSGTGDAEGEVRTYRELLEQSPGEPATLNNLAYALAERAKRPAEALPYAEEACQKSPRNSAFLDTLGCVYFKLGKFDQAEGALREALGVEPRNLAANYHLGVLLAERGRAADARAALQYTLELATQVKDAEHIQKAQEALDRLK